MASDTPAGQPATLPAAAVQAATGALHYGDPAENDGTGCACTDADQHDEFWHRDQADAIRALEAAAPHLAKATLNDFRRTSRQDYQDTYRDWWAGIVEHPDGTLNRDQVARELADYADLMRAASEVYCAITNGRISKPNTLPQAVIGLAEECAQELADEASREATAAERERRIVSAAFACGSQECPRPFALYRHQDVTGVSGTGTVAHGAQFADGAVVIRWLGEKPSTVVWASLDDAMAVHGHDGKTRLVWLAAEFTEMLAAEQQAVAPVQARADELHALATDMLAKAGRTVHRDRHGEAQWAAWQAVADGGSGE